MNIFTAQDDFLKDWISTPSQIVTPQKTIQLEWKETAPDEWAATNELGTWHLHREFKGTSVIFRSKAELSGNMDTFEFRMFILSTVPADHVLPLHLHMVNTHAFLTKQSAGQNFTSYNTCSVTFGNKTVLVSNPLDQKQMVVYSGHIEDGKVENFTVTHQVRHYAPRRIEFAPITFADGNGFTLLENYGTENAPEKLDACPPLPGWNSWDYYRTTVSEDEVLKNAEFIAKDPVLSRYVKRIIVDDGWEYCYGEWEPNPYFSSGMKYLADELKKMNFEAGLWFAPCIVEPVSPISQLHYNMLACSEGGQPCLTFSCMQRVGFILDPTVPESQNFLRDTFDRYCRMGYTYFKLDFLRWVMEARRFADSSVPKSKLVNRLLEPVHEGIAGRATVTGCNYPFMTGSKYVDAVRIASDIHSDWQKIKGNAAAVSGRYWMNGKLWYSDPDFAICRGVDTTYHPDTLMPNLINAGPDSPYDPVCFKTYSSAGKAELETLLSVILMAAGAVNLSDDLTKLNENGLELARRVVSAERGENGIPLDLFTSEQPAFWLQKLHNGGRFLMINWKDTEQELQIPDQALSVIPEYVQNFWTGEKFHFERKIYLMPHHCLLIEW